MQSERRMERHMGDRDIYIYIEREREGEKERGCVREREGEREREHLDKHGATQAHVCLKCTNAVIQS